MGRHDIRSRIEHTLVKELSLYVTIYSPVHMVMDLPENYRAHPDAFQFIKDVSTDWEKPLALSGEIGEYLVIARKDRNSDDWYVAAHTNEDTRKVEIPVNFLQEGDKYLAQIYRDGDNAYFESKPYDIIIEEKVLTSNQTLTFDLGRSGGVAIRFIKQSAASN